MAASPWILDDGPASIRVFCFPYAGGGASIYKGWQAGLPAGMRLCRVQLPGRETRFSEPAFHHMDPLAEALLDGLRPHFASGPYILFGHSMGGSIAAEITRRLVGGNGRPPLHLIVSASRPSHIPAPHPIHALPDAEFRAALARDGGTPSAVIESDELMGIFSPTLRADHAVVETWIRPRPERIPVPITCIAGRRDSIVPHAIASTWQLHAGGGYRQIDIDDGHFFLRNHATAMQNAIALAAAPMMETTV